LFEKRYAYRLTAKSRWGLTGSSARAGGCRARCCRKARWVSKATGFLDHLGIKSRGDGDNELSILLPNNSRFVGYHSPTQHPRRAANSSIKPQLAPALRHRSRQHRRRHRLPRLPPNPKPLARSTTITITAGREPTRLKIAA
jgi:hypothetical protein